MNEECDGAVASGRMRAHSWTSCRKEEIIFAQLLYDLLGLPTTLGTGCTHLTSDHFSRFIFVYLACRLMGVSWRLMSCAFG